MSAVEAMQRAEALLERLRDPEPEVAELLEEAERLTVEMETRWPNGKPDDPWERTAFAVEKAKLSWAVYGLAKRGVSLDEMRPALTLIRGGRDG